ncbi:DUF2200 domain-containing protein [Aurantiacibacter gilvus]|uniref:DUF2200 domain-containing protein n=1 Tax=Aurantiacibacter gilvus TaxID=3139141 RepID=A0ABU9IDH4_9SPHN
MPRKTIGEIEFGKVYPMYVQKVEKKGRTKVELDEVIAWLTGYDEAGLAGQIAKENDFATFFAEAPALNPAADQITGVICGYRVEEIEDPLTQKIRWLDKIVDELAKGKAMEKIKRG